MLWEGMAQVQQDDHWPGKVSGEQSKPCETSVSVVPVHRSPSGLSPSLHHQGSTGGKTTPKAAQPEAGAAGQGREALRQGHQ